MTKGLSWLGVIRLGLVQTALGAIVVLATSTLNRVMVVEWQLIATLPGALVAFHYVVQLSRPRWGHGADQSGRRAPWILGGMAVLAIGGALAAFATALMGAQLSLGIGLAVFAFLLIGAGVGASGTALLSLLAVRVSAQRKGAAASIVWTMMIAGLAGTAATAGALLDPFSPERLVAVCGGVCAIAFAVAALAVSPELLGGERRARDAAAEVTPARIDFRAALKEVWAEAPARRFTLFVFISMLAYSAQDLILEPFAGIGFGFSPGESTALAGAQHGGALLGMIVAGLAGGAIGGRRFGSLRLWTVCGCLASAVALAGLTFGAAVAPDWPLTLNVVLLGLANGVFAVAAIGAMMGLANAGAEGRQGVRIGLWGAAQAIGFGLGGFAGAASADLLRTAFDSPVGGYGAVFAAEAALFILAAALAAKIDAQGALGEAPARNTGDLAHA